MIESLHEAMKIFLIHSKIKYDEIDEEEKQKTQEFLIKLR